MLDLYDELRKVIGVLDSEGVDYAVCGGIAVALYGHVRATQALDILIGPEDVDRARGLLAEHGYVHESTGVPFHAADGTERRVERVTRVSDSDHLTIDLRVADAEPWVGALANRERRELDAATVEVVSREGLIAMKRESDRLIDRDDIEKLSRS